MNFWAKTLSVVLATSATFALTACDDKETSAKKTAETTASTVATPSAQTEPLKVGFVYVAPIADVGWTKQHDDGRLMIEKQFGDKIKTTYVENVPETADAERVIRQMALDGNQIIFGTTFGYMNYMQKLAREFPNVKFEHCTGYKNAPNMNFYNARFYEGRYLAGMVAGSLTKTNVLGYVAAFPIPEVLQGINAFTLGAQKTNPNVQVKVVWTSSWYDPGKDADSTKTLVGQGADVLTQHTNTSAVASAAEAAGKMVIPYNSDMKRIAPNGQIATVSLNWSQYYLKKVQEMLEGRWTNDSVWASMKDGIVKLDHVSDKVPPQVLQEIKSVESKIIKGEWAPFTGPILNNEGKEVVAAGQSLSDDDLQKMNFYVKGVVGKVPQ